MGRQGLDRRQMLKGMGATLGFLALRGYDAAAAAPAHFTHGVASGDPLADRVILWSRVLPGDGQLRDLQVRWEVAEDLNFSRIVAQGRAATGAHRDYTVKVDAAGLAPGKTYFYRFSSEGVVSPVGRTRTLPTGAVAAFSIGLCSCSNYPQGYFHAYRELAKADVDVVMHVGDYIYEYEAGKYSNPVATGQLGREVKPSNELLVLEDYRMRYGLYRTDPDLQAAHAAHPWICVWDDHELCNDTWRAGAENHNEGEGDFVERIAAARKAYHEWLPIRTAAQTDQGPIYRNFRVGDLADLIMLDTRLHGRDQQLSYFTDLPKAENPVVFRDQVLAAQSRTILGADQEAWLASQLAASKDRGATWQVLGQQVLMGRVMIPEIPASAMAGVELSERSRRYFEAMQKLAPLGMPMNLDAWDGYPACRERIHGQLLELAANPVVLAGDTHNAWAFNMRDQAGRAVGVEIGTPGISSPGLETYLPLPPDALNQALRASSEELVSLDTYRRGWSEIKLTP
ncbi:MAG: alkaline phosphatase D family protein, partial [Halieaceae bacterium]|nr:alkaline phosphatase D family protein [Halieaceae bacterium]